MRNGFEIRQVCSDSIGANWNPKVADEVTSKVASVFRHLTVLQIASTSGCNLVYCLPGDCRDSLVNFKVRPSRLAVRLRYNKIELDFILIRLLFILASSLIIYGPFSQKTQR